MSKKLEELISYQYSKEEERLYPLLCDYLKKTYGNVEIFKPVYYYEKTKHRRHIEELSRITIYLKRTAALHHVYDILKKRHDINCEADQQEIRKIICRLGLQEYFHADILFICYDSFEFEAISHCYNSASKDFKIFKKKYFNSDTMAWIDPSVMFIVYKTKELMEEAERNGEQARIREDYYQFIKQFDQFGLITRDKHLLVHFDYAGHARSPREYYELHYEMMGN